MNQRVLFLLLIVHVAVAGFGVLPGLYAYERGMVPGHGEGVWRYATPASDGGYSDAPDETETVGSCQWPQAMRPDDPGPGYDESGPLVIGHAFCQRFVPERSARRGKGAPSYRT